MLPVIVIFAPTACGKTALAREIFGKSSLSYFKGMGEVVSADSQAVYKGLDIGTAKPSAEERVDIPHHCIDIADPRVQFGVGEWLEEADRACREIASRHKFPIVTGGSGFYIRSFLLGLPSTPESDSEIRRQIKERLAQKGDYALYQELKECDAESAKKIRVHDSYRVCRALEVFYSSGRPLSSFAVPDRLRECYDFCSIILTRKREDLYSRINARVDAMFDLGLCKEVLDLKKQGIGRDSPAMKAIGYGEFFDCQPGIEALEAAQNSGYLDAVKEKIKADSRRYAKRQYTFMRGIPGAVTFDMDDRTAIEQEILRFCRSRGEYL
ncbi:MAG TPA: tRNA (adenosine(37)-N6)-dimethylallyltransferase MiaA [Treponema sp.]|nr:tRNA (adenosine(37)-N6)-dimethylallyltransferase MiaA [Treponema sp.]